MKRMIISSIVFVFDAFGLFNTLSDYQAFIRTGMLPEQDIGRDFFTELMLWGIIAVISIIFFIFGFIAHKNNN